MAQKDRHVSAVFLVAFILLTSLLMSSCASSQDKQYLADVQRAFEDVQCRDVVDYYRSYDGNLMQVADVSKDKDLPYEMIAAYCVSGEQGSSAFYQRLIEQGKLSDGSIEQWVEQGGQLENQGDFPLAAVYYTSAYWVTSYQHDDPQYPSRDLLDLAILSSQNAQHFKEALWLLEERRAILEYQDSALNLLIEHALDHAATHQLNKDYAAARYWYTQVISYFYELNASDRRLASIYLARGQLAIKQGLSLEALNDLFVAYALFGQDEANLGLVAYHLGDVYRDAGNLTDAAEYFERSVDRRTTLYSSNPSPGRAMVLAESKEALADVQFMLGQIDSAGELYRASIELLTPWLGVDSEPVNDIKRKLADLKVNLQDV